MLVEYTRHSRKRMRWRKIDQADVELVLAYPDRIEPSGEGRISAYKMLGERLLKVTYFQEQNLIKVITAVWKGE